MMFSDEGLLAIKVVAAAAPLAGFAAVAHVRARRRARRAHEIAAALSKTRSVFIEVPKSEATPRGSVHFELTPHLTACLAAAGSGSLSGFRSPDAVMMAMEIEAAWASMGEPAMPEDPRHRSRLIATRELVVIRSTFPPCESAKVQLRGLLEAHRSNPEGEPLYCAAEGSIQAGAGRRQRIEALQHPRKDFYWVRADTLDADRKAEAHR
jgi:hypothetical protein